MFTEAGVVDANVLVYAMDADAPQHAASRALLDAARAGAGTHNRDDFAAFSELAAIAPPE
jgi:predicted nucleic acid-binding protein